MDDSFEHIFCLSKQDESAIEQCFLPQKHVAVPVVKPVMVKQTSSNKIHNNPFVIKIRAKPQVEQSGFDEDILSASW
jgi:hypothetical protein